MAVVVDVGVAWQVERKVQGRKSGLGPRVPVAIAMVERVAGRWRARSWRNKRRGSLRVASLTMTVIRSRLGAARSSSIICR